MNRLLLEFFSEEIPARMQTQAGVDLVRLLGAKLEALGMPFGTITPYVTPRRLVAIVTELPGESPTLTQEKKGPKIDAPLPAIQGFLKSAGLESLDQCRKVESPKGDYWVADVTTRGKKTSDVIPNIVREIINEFPWPKSMRWRHSETYWVRPLQGITCIYSGIPVCFTVDLSPSLPEGDPRKVIIEANGQTQGHRFLSRNPFDVMNFEDYKAKLQSNYVILDPKDRKESILSQITELASSKGLVLKEDLGLLEEVAGLVEWPVAYLGRIDDRFMHLPREVLSTTMRVHQRYFSLETREGDLAPWFVIMANTITNDEGETLVSGNERVLRARLSDAAFFYEQDQKQSLEYYLGTLDGLIFHAQLGTMAQKAKRLESLSGYIAEALGSNAVFGARAGLLAKADLATQMVGEFPEIQGIMGRYYTQSSEDKSVSEAIGEHYSPKGPGDRVPTAPLSIAVSLADKLDTLVGFFSVGIHPTGSKDPYALRRATLGIIRVLLENGLKDLPLEKIFHKAYDLYKSQGIVTGPFPDTLNAFVIDRLKVYFRDLGFGHECISAILDSFGEGNLVQLFSKLKDLDSLLKTENGQNAVAGYKRALNIVRIEEKKMGTVFKGTINEALLSAPQEKSLYHALQGFKADAPFSEIMTSLGSLRPVLDDFFNEITVNDPDESIRLNRLNLLAHLGHSIQPIVNLEGL